MELGVPVEEPKVEIQTNGKHALFIMIFLVIAMVAFAIGAISVNRFLNRTSGNDSELEFDHFLVAKYNDEPVYVYKSEYRGDYGLSFRYFTEYTVGDRDDAALEEFNQNKNYAVIAKSYIGAPNVKVGLAEVYEDYDAVWVYYYDDASGVTADITGFVMVIPVGDTVTRLNSTSMYTQEEYQNLLKYSTTYDPNNMTVDKPIIYLYPEEETEVTVKLGNVENLIVSYPKYTDGWKVLARPNGDLTDLTTGRGLYALYYESELENKFSVKEDGFIVAGEDVAEFLEEKLATLGLNEREAEEFIIYWLPELETNKYNYIRFATADEINKNTELKVSPKPDSVIRVWMSFKGLNEKISVKEQKLETPERKGFTVVEWGATKL